MSLLPSAPLDVQYPDSGVHTSLLCGIPHLWPLLICLFTDCPATTLQSWTCPCSLTPGFNVPEVSSKNLQGFVGYDKTSNAIVVGFRGTRMSAPFARTSFTVSNLCVPTQKR